MEIILAAIMVMFILVLTFCICNLLLVESNVLISKQFNCMVLWQEHYKQGCDCAKENIKEIIKAKAESTEAINRDLNWISENCK